MRNIKDMFDLTGKTVVVTGGAGHLGAGISEALAAFGADMMPGKFDESVRVCGRNMMG